MKPHQSIALVGVLGLTVIGFVFRTDHQPVSFAQATPPVATPKPALPEIKPYSTRQGRTIRLKPVDATFKIPQEWLNWHRQFGHNVFLSRKELEFAKESIGESRRTYAQVVNSVLPFDTCAVHVGGDIWGTQYIGSGGNMQARVYISHQNIPEVWRRIETDGKKKVSADYALQKGSKPTVVTTQRGEWQGKKLSYTLFFVDYFANDSIEFLARRFNDWSVIFVFMYGSNDSVEEKKIGQILNSFVWKS